MGKSTPKRKSKKGTKDKKDSEGIEVLARQT